ncbi:kinase-like domain-containing protein [Chaetomium strumarium]|uniref:Kinase-like domain-containing protein n=1 Tax=Chaetomium strumarium TaxID=1170767 RepID=A0AAJ0LYR9_9PEZI|nr:kinase-like domain-containing protein [Chaetomium strumarium]
MADNTSLINLPTGFDFKDYIGGGNSGIVLLDKHTLTVIKIRLDGDHSPEIDIERQIYERFIERGGQKGIPIFYGTFKHGIRLDHVAEALDFVHECGVIHGDVQGFNVLIDWRLDAKLADFAGSSLDGSPLLIATNESHTCPGRGLSRKGDIFALGSTNYELMTGCPPYAGLSDSVIRSRYSKGQYPDTKSLGAVGSIITKCWRGNCEELHSRLLVTQ